MSSLQAVMYLDIVQNLLFFYNFQFHYQFENGRCEEVKLIFRAQNRSYLKKFCSKHFIDMVDIIIIITMHQTWIDGTPKSINQQPWPQYP